MSRIDSRIYSESLRELRERHREEFEEIRSEKLAAAGVEIRAVEAKKAKEKPPAIAFEPTTNPALPPVWKWVES